MSSVRPLIGAIRTSVRPQLHGSELRLVRSPVQVADHRHGLFRQRREHEHALRPLGQWVERVGIDDLGQEVILVDVGAGPLLVALARDARPITSESP